MTPYGKGYTGEIKVNAPHPRSYGAEKPLGDSRPGNPERYLTPNTAAEMRAYCRVHGLPITGPVLCRAIPAPAGATVRGTPTVRLLGQVEAL